MDLSHHGGTAHAANNPIGLFFASGNDKEQSMRRILRDLKIMLMTNLWIVPVVAALVGALFYFVAPPPPMHARMATGAPSGGYHAFAELSLIHI